MKKIISEVFKYFVLILAVAAVILPILPVLFGSLKSNVEFHESNVLAPPKAWEWSNFQKAFIDGQMLLGFGNTILVMGVSIVISVLIGAMTSYVLHRFRFPGHGVVKTLFLLAALIPAVTNNIAVFQIISDLNIFNTRWAGIVLFSGTDIISVYIFLQFMDNISESLDEAAMMDGASYFRIFFTIIAPLLLPAIATVMIIKGVSIYNDFTTPFLFMPKASLAMISTSLYNFSGPFGARWEIICAGIIIVSVPALIVFLALQKWIYSGLVAGSVKS